jgi:mannosyltransferase
MRPRVAALLALTVAGGLLRFATLDLQSFWFDEAVTVRLVEMDLGGMLDEVPESESTPPLYYVLAWLWAKAFGTGEVGLRSLSALAGTLAIPAMYAAAAELCSRRIGLAVAALAAVNPMLVWYAQEARSYSLLVLFSALSVWGFALVLGRADGRGAALWGLASALALATHYFAGFLVVPEAIWLLVSRRTRRPAIPAVAGVVACAAVLLPLATHQRSQELTSWITGSLAERGARTAKNLAVGFDSPLETVTAAAALGIAAAGVLLAARAARSTRGVAVAAGLGLAAAGLPVVLDLLGSDYVEPRNLLIAWLPLTVVVAAGLLSVRAGTAGVVMLCVLGLTAVVAVAAEPAWQREDWRSIAGALGAPRGQRAIVVQPANGDTPLGLYAGGLRPLRVEGDGLQEIVAVHPVSRAAPGPHPGPPALPAVSAPPGFSVVERDSAGTYTLIRLRAERPVRLTPAQLAAIAVVPGEPAALLVQGPGQDDSGTR